MGEGSVVTHLNGSDITRDSQAKRSGAQGKDFWVSRLLPGRTGWWGRGQGVGRRAQNEKLTPSNPRGWPNRSGAADLEERPQRAVILNSEQGHWFCSNFVRTSKYTHLDFLPRFLMEEFHPRRKMANVYFLVLASLQTIPETTNTFRVPTILLPLSIVVIVDAVFAILEDVARHRADAKANASPTRALDCRGSKGRFRRVEWRDVRVGDLLLVKNRESIPADLLVMGAHEPNPEAKAGICYVETKSLDGETNLKIRQAIRPVIGRVSCPQDAASLRGVVEMEHPNKLISNFSGSIELEGAGETCREAILTRNLLLRGCVLRNTRWVVGLVLNTGADTKIIMSSLEPPQKSSRLEQRTNIEVWRIVQLLCLVCLLGAIGSLVWNKTTSAEHVYLMLDLEGWGNHVKEAFIQFLYLFLLLGNFIPVSLYVSMGTVKFCQSFFMRQDLDMYHKETDTPALVRTMALNEELGQVSHVFSDKTGTLTENVMDFRKCSIGGVSYGRGVTAIGRAVAAEMGETEVSKEDLEAEEIIAERPEVPHVRFYDPRLLDDLRGNAGEEQRELLSDFFLALAVCHTVIPEKGVSTTSSSRRRRLSKRQHGSSNDGDKHLVNSSVDKCGVMEGDIENVSPKEREREEECSEDSDGRADDDCCGDEDDIDCCIDDGIYDIDADGDGEREREEGVLEEMKRREGEKGRREEKEDEAPPKLSASSPDDEALVLGARHFGMEFRDRIDNNACVRRSGAFLTGAVGKPSLPMPRGFVKSGSSGSGRHGSSSGTMPGAQEEFPRRSAGDRYVDERYAVLRILDFTSARKRMSVIVRDPQGRVRILCKGADSVMIPRLASAANHPHPGSSSANNCRKSLTTITSVDDDDNKEAFVDVDPTPKAGAAVALTIGSGLLPRLASTAPMSKAWSPHGKTSTGGGGVGGGSGLGRRFGSVDLANVLTGFGDNDADGEKKRGGLEDDSWSTNSEDNSPNGPKSRKRTLAHMERYAREGLRTLIVTCADVEEHWYREWDKKFEVASTDLAEIEKKKNGLDNAIDNLMDEVETNLCLLGCTAIEDKLQDGVGACVEALQGAGVKVWMLTGDKEETAINIGVACRLLGQEKLVERIIVNMDPQSGCQDVDDVRDRLEGELKRISEETSRVKKGGRGTLRDGTLPRAFIIDGLALTLALEPLCRRFLAELTMNCVAVICCRVSPDQKREMVALVRETFPQARTLAIGDGANDVAMIQGAHIGIGISGQEGMQAVNASDFAIAQFRFLRKLMLFHGRQNYRRMSKLVVYTFYKNILMAMPMALYVVVNGYSGQKFYTEGGIQFYNIFFTLWPILFLGCFDRDVSLGDTEKNPRLYVLGINDVFFNAKVFWSWMAQATAEAVLITAVPIFLVKGGPGDFGTEQSLFFFGGTTFTLVIILANSKILWLQYRWTWWAAVLVVLSILAWFSAGCVLTSLVYLDYDFFMVYFHLIANPSFWAVVTLCTTAVVMRDLTWKFFHRWWQPKLHHVILEVEATGGTPVELSPEEWAAASARGIAIGGPDHAAGGGNGSGGMAGSIVAGAGSDFDRSHGAGASIEGLSVVTDWPTTIGESEESVPGGGSTPGKWNDVATLTGGVPSRSGNTRSSPAFPAVMEESEGSSRRRRRMDGSAPLRDHERRSPAILTAGFWLRGVELGGGSVGGLMSRVREEKHLTGVDGFSSEGGQAAQRGERNDATAANQQLSDMFSSRVSEVDGGGQEGGTPTDVSRRRSLSWTLPLKPYSSWPEGIGHPPIALQRSRSERTKNRRPVAAGSRASHLRPPSSGYAYSTDEASASLESEMILNYIESPLKKTPSFWDTPQTVDRLARRQERGLLPAGYGAGRWMAKSSAVAVGPKSQRREVAGVPVIDGSLDGGGGPGNDNGNDNFNVSARKPWRAPTWLKSGDGTNSASNRTRGAQGVIGSSGSAAAAAAAAAADADAALDDLGEVDGGALARSQGRLTTGAGASEARRRGRGSSQERALPAASTKSLKESPTSLGLRMNGPNGRKVDIFGGKITKK